MKQSDHFWSDARTSEWLQSSSLPAACTAFGRARSAAMLETAVSAYVTSEAEEVGSTLKQSPNKAVRALRPLDGALEAASVDAVGCTSDMGELWVVA